MLDSLRNAASTWIAKLLLGLLVLSFAVWGISGQILNDQSRNVLTVGDSSVSMLDYRLAYDRQINTLSQRLGTRVTREQAVAFGIDEQVLQQLAAGALLDEEARKLGLGLSSDRLAQLTADDPAFRGPDGRFNRQQFDFVLSQIGMRPEDYLRNREQVAIRQQIVEAATDGMSVPDELFKNLALYRGEDRTIEYVALPQALVEPVATPDDATLQAWFDERKAEYAAPEYRKFSYVKLEPSDISDPASVSEDQVKKAYDDLRNRYTTPEKRTIEQIVFPDREAAEAALKNLLDGQSFADVATAAGKSADDIALGTLAQGEIADSAIAEAAFALSENQFSDVLDGTFGPVIVNVSEVQAEVVQPLSEVEDEIRQDLALEEASRVLLDVHDAYEDARAGGATMAEAAERMNLTMRTIEAIDATARRPDGAIVGDLPVSAELIREVFESDSGIENAPLSMGGNGFIFYEVEGITSERDRTLDEVREEVTQDWIAAETDRLLAARAAELAQKVKDGVSLDDIALEIDQQKQVKRGVKRTANDADLGQAGVAAVFSVPRDGSGVFANPAGDGQVLFRVTEVFEPASATAQSIPENQRDAMRTGLADDLLDQMVARLQGKHPVTVNRAAMQEALSF
ncbi:SurA N-terminal domain-containing protein [Nitratireductor sp. GZWM139]|uniref:SurA N-terminal domain-containing protein n=1 Tax=Nitratireductor sp. GZWM139 TaxID=2950541 RepID=UPI0024BD8231|nr:SurA N-terminal domain-containing protein [Nitratireductor sp. GZWM139]MDJ1464109.1 SurA N-terminal domain-containing protein [Nitratireductor sp. GZWM139]